ncbi:MAG: TRAM domain-containing protein, partial [Chloroflexota bacterium]
MVEAILVTLEKLTYGGEAMGRLPEARAVFVPFALPGEQVRIHLVEEKRVYARSELLEIIQPASERITARCPHFVICGGCH